MLDITLPDVGFEGAIQSVMSRTLAPRLVEGVLAGKATEEDILPVTINRASPYYQETGLDLSVGDQITASVDTGAGEKMVQLEAIGILENKDDGVVFYTDTENLQGTGGDGLYPRLVHCGNAGKRSGRHASGAAACDR